MIRRVAATWHVKRWARVAPRLTGAAIIVAFPALYFMELDHGLLGGNWSDWTGGLSVIAVLVLAAVIGRDVARPRASWLWLYQKRASVADAAMTGWLMNLGIAAIALVWWAVVLQVAAGTGGRAADSAVVASLGQWLALFGTASALLYATAALRLEYGVEILFVLVVAAAVEPLVSLAFAPPVGTTLHLLLPPVGDARALRVLLSAGEWSGAMRSLAHVCAFMGACLAAGTLMLARWRPGSL